jgi:hypothetical protein
MKAFTCVLALFLVIFIIGCSENKEITSPLSSTSEDRTTYYLYITVTADGNPGSGMPFAGECAVYKSTNGVNWAADVPFSWRTGDNPVGRYELDSTYHYFKWQGYNAGEPNAWQTYTAWYGCQVPNPPTADIHDTCIFYQD